MSAAPLIPVRMVNEVVYCPRLFALEHLDREWADSHDTVRGQTVHKRVDNMRSAPLPDNPEGSEKPVVSRSVTLSDAELGMVAKIDLVEADAGVVVPVDYKKGKVPAVEHSAYLPERVQVCAQALLLRAHGYDVPHGVLYFAGSRKRVTVELTDELIAQTLAAVADARAILGRPEPLPAPLIDSPKCFRCSLNAICLPDETNVLQGRSGGVRTLAPPYEEGLPLYVTARGSKLALRAGEIVVKVEGKVVEKVRIAETSRVVVSGAASMTSPLLARLAKESIPVALHSWGGKLLGSFVPAGGHNTAGRIAQHRVAASPVETLPLARSFVEGKIRNQRVLLRRNASGLEGDPLRELAHYAEQALIAPSVAVLLGIEGMAARVYFGQFSRMLKSQAVAFELDGRNRRPPKDPVNAMLSFVYACLARECTNVLHGVGLDPYVGFLHRPRPGKPALALDLMEEFRPIVADSVVVSALNNGVLGPDSFVVHRLGCSMKDGARKALIRAFERRLAQEFTHPLFQTAMSYRRVLEVQARLISKVVRGDIPSYPPLRVR